MKELLFSALVVLSLSGCASQQPQSSGSGATGASMGVYSGQGTSGSPVSNDSSGSKTGDTDSEITPVPESQ